eukprot:CAMPEP_0113642730 /NCGR_PEP_ID=MMETSP0017_2-20120614/22450_1 /TAXON_ID=2856 /ORGANISM="Cylindrotheca closterium" /LENGTH=311 /DNA_ID=CAMNT_0000554173 /DNA_START=132 /DNA_END=1064 /DNA_ORIENTATION=- /assembly_acc=CAM_ASM_000147
MSNPWNRALWLGLSAAASAVAYKLYKNLQTTSSTSKGSSSSPTDGSSNEEKVNELVLQRFQACSEYMGKNNRITKLPQATQLELYAWYKQATVGSLDPNKTKAPRSYDMVGTAKYNAWKKLQGMSKSSAMQLYIDKAMLVEFTASMQGDGNDDDDDADEMEDAVMDIGGMGNKPSTLNFDDSDEENDDNDANTAKDHPLHEAAMSGKLEELKQLLLQKSNNNNSDDGENDGAMMDPNGQDSTGQTALHMCADRGNLDCLNLLIESGAEVDIGDQDGITPLQTAVISGHAKVCERLLEAGADPDKPDNDGDT